MFVSYDRHLFVVIYVANLLLFSFDDSRLTDIQDRLNARFKMTNLGEISHYLGIKVDIEVEKEIFFPADQISQENTSAVSDGRMQAGINSQKPRSGQLPLSI